MQNKWWILLAVGCGTFMATLDASIVNIALPTLTRSLDATLDQIKWVIVIYYLLVTCLVLPFGALSDFLGRKKVFLSGFIIFTLGSLFCSISGSLSTLLIARALQAIGAALMMTNGPAIITVIFPGMQRGRALGVLAMAVSLGLVTGPSLGGFLIAHWGWPSIFYVNLPVGILGIFLVFKNVPKDLPCTKSGAFDWAGSFLQLCIILLCIIIFEPPNISISGSIPFEIPRWFLALLCTVFIGLFLEIEKTVPNPICDLSLIKNRTFWSANLAGFLLFTAYSSISVLMPFFLQEMMHFEPDVLGLFMSAIPLAIFVLAPLSGRVSDHLGSRELTVTGSLISAGGLFTLSGVFGWGLSSHMSHFQILLTLLMSGVALGVFQSPNNNAIMGSVPPEKLGAASGMVATFRNLGVVLGTGMATTVFQWRFQFKGDFEEAMRFTFLICAFVSLFAAFAAFGTKAGPTGKRNMSWLNKEKELTLEEAMELAKKELLPYWIKSDPLVAALKDEDGVFRAFPLEKIFAEQPWMIFFIDLTKISFENVFTLSREWEKRFKQYGLSTLFVVQESYGFFRNKYLIRQSLDRSRINQITVLDHDSLLKNAFQIQEIPSFLLYHKRQVVFMDSLKTFSPEIETKIHQFLRTINPGLPLYPPFDPKTGFAVESYSIELGKGRGCEFLKEIEVSNTLSETQVILKGKWLFETDSISTADPKAELLINAKSPNLFIFARTLSRTDEPSRINVLCDETPMYDMFFGRDMVFIEGNHSMILPKEGRLYSTLANLPEDKRNITLRFPIAAKAPLAIYSLCFSH